MPTVDVNGRTIGYRDRGEGRPPLLLIHGAGGSSLHFAPLLPLLAHRRRAVVVDLPGHGASAVLDPLPPPAELLEAYRDVVAETAERLGLGKVILVGHSMGGAVAQLFAIAYPERVAALVLIATASRLKVDPPILEQIRHHYQALPEMLGAIGYSPATEPAQIQRWASLQLQATQRVVLADFEACARFDLRRRLGEIACPTWVVSAADDRLTPPVLQERLATAIRGAQLITVTRSGHFLLFERPETVADAILASCR
jgi:pimeloyl-ACP methyl ester carboxylesterase